MLRKFISDRSSSTMLKAGSIILSILSANYPRIRKMIAQAPDLAHFFKGFQVFAWGKQKKRQNLNIE